MLLLAASFSGQTVVHIWSTSRLAFVAFLARLEQKNQKYMNMFEKVLDNPQPLSRR